jgi:hypothetical protein
MKTKLIVLPQHPIIVSDEDMVLNDRVWNEIVSKILRVTDVFKPHGDKIIAGLKELPLIDFDGLEEKFGIVDVTDLAEKRFPWMDHGNYQDHYIEGYMEGFKKSQSLNEKVFSLVDMFNCFEAGELYQQEGIILQPDAHGFIKSLQQHKSFDVEIMPIYDSDVELERNREIDYKGHTDIEQQITTYKIIKVIM